MQRSETKREEEEKGSFVSLSLISTEQQTFTCTFLSLSLHVCVCPFKLNKHFSASCASYPQSVWVFFPVQTCLKQHEVSEEG